MKYLILILFIIGCASKPKRDADPGHPFIGNSTIAPHIFRPSIDSELRRLTQIKPDNMPCGGLTSKQLRVRFKNDIIFDSGAPSGVGWLRSDVGGDSVTTPIPDSVLLINDHTITVMHRYILVSGKCINSNLAVDTIQDCGNISIWGANGGCVAEKINGVWKIKDAAAALEALLSMIKEIQSTDKKHR
jgi:hypothetical protein